MVETINLPPQARVVIIGGGVVGVSCLYHLARAGWQNCVLLEKNELTSGSTWHAAGNVPTFSAQWSIMQMQRYSVELYKQLAAETSYPINYHVTGSLRLAHTKERMQEFHHVKAMARYQAMAFEILGVEDMRHLYPFLQTHDLQGALYDPNDGDIDPAQLTQALAKGARDKGAKIIRFCDLTAAQRIGDEWLLTTNQGEIRCDIVVNAAGYRAAEVGRLFGRKVPMAVMSHQYLIFEEIPELKAWSHENGHKLPLLRDVDSSYYLRQEKNGMNLGPYERTPRAHWHEAKDSMPDDFSFQLFPDDLERLEWYLEDTLARVPILGKAGLSKIINGPIPYTPDGNPLIGPMPGVENAFEACVFTFGIAQAGGAGKILAEWIMEGHSEWDMWACDPRRFTDFIDLKYCVDRAIEVYVNEYASPFPHRAWLSGRNCKTSPIHEFLQKMGAQFAPYNGWERANWFAKQGDNIDDETYLTFRRDGVWQNQVRQECLNVRDNAGLLDLPGFSRFHISGQGARNWLAYLSTSAIPQKGRIGLAYFADEKGRLITEMSIMTLAEDEFLLISPAAAEWHDYEWLKNHLPKTGTINIENITNHYHCQILSGPKSRDILNLVCSANLTKNWLTHQKTTIANCPCRLVRVSFAGELGWEIHSHKQDSEAIFTAIWQSGQNFDLSLFGMWALDSLRLEKGYRSWRQDLSTDYTILQAGLERFIKWDKLDFLGKQALMAEQAKGVEKSFVTMIVECDVYDAPYMATIWNKGERVGEVTSSGYGHRIDASIALGVVRADVALPGGQVEIDIYGKKHKAFIQPDAPLWDKNNERLRG